MESAILLLTGQAFPGACEETDQEFCGWT